MLSEVIFGVLLFCAAVLVIALWVGWTMWKMARVRRAAEHDVWLRERMADSAATRTRLQRLTK